jgi:hypothetical protein
MFCLGMVHRSKIYYAHINCGSLCDNAPSKGYALLKICVQFFCKIYTLIFSRWISLWIISGAHFAKRGADEGEQGFQHPRSAQYAAGSTIWK